MSEMHDRAARFVAHLQARQEDRGLMADLRRGFSETTADRTWPHIAPWCELTNPRQRVIYQTIGAAFATQPEATEEGNMGNVMRRLAMGDGRGEDGLKTFDSRFRRFLSCTAAQEICDRLPSIIRAAGNRSIPINHVQLLTDLWFWDWNDYAKIRWASAYWGTGQPE